MFRATWAALLLGIAWLAPGCATRPPRALPPARTYLRVEESTNRVVSLRVAVRSLERPDGTGPRVRLVGVTHLGDAEYYRGLQQLLDAEALVLFEGVGAKDKRMSGGEDAAYSLQPAMARALGLRFQLDTIDYRGSNFVNSDLTLAQLQQVLESGPAGDSGQLGELVSLMDGSSFLGTLVRFGLGVVESSPRLRATVRLSMIELLGAVDSDLGDTGALPADMRRLMEVLIAERNKAVVADLRRQVGSWPAWGRRRGKDRPGIAVFYGAGHMVDLERRITSELGYRPVAEEWRTAFAVDPVAAGLTEPEMRMARALVREQLRTLKGR